MRKKSRRAKIQKKKNDYSPAIGDLGCYLPSREARMPSCPASHYPCWIHSYRVATSLDKVQSCHRLHFVLDYRRCAVHFKSTISLLVVGCSLMTAGISAVEVAVRGARSGKRHSPGIFIFPSGNYYGNEDANTFSLELITIRPSAQI